MNKVEGKISVKGVGIGIPGLIVFVYDLDPGTEPEESPGAFGSLSEAALTPKIGADCLGSTFTNEDGFFELTYEDTAFRVQTPDEERPDLSLMVLAPESPGHDPETRLIYASNTVRQNAGQKEYFLIDIPPSLLQQAGVPVPEATSAPEKEGPLKSARSDQKVATSVEEGPKIPDHTLLRPIDKGSYGEVWLAKNIFGHLRAVKIVYAKTFAEDQSYRREFLGLLHFEPVSRSHPGFVQIFHVGCNEAGRYFFYVMELADPIKNGDSAGTQGYVPPEGPGAVQADLYALGKVIYEALTGKDRTQFPEFPPFRHDPSPGDQKRLIGLNDIILKAADQEVKRRYQSAAALYYDLMDIVKSRA